MPFNKKTAREAGKKSSRKGVSNGRKQSMIIQEFISTIKSGTSYVYYHVNNETHEVFYIGKGKGNRAWNTGRNDYYEKYLEEINNNYTVRLVALNLSDEEALAIEEALIRIKNPICNISGT